MANLHARLRDFGPEALSFVYDFDQPYDNNLVERDVRMVKVRQKILGCFRSEQGAAMFCRICGDVSTGRMQSRNTMMESLTEAFAERPFDPSDVPS